MKKIDLTGFKNLSGLRNLKLKKLKKISTKFIFILLTGNIISCAQTNDKNTATMTTNNIQNPTSNIDHSQDTATFGAGCFWCVEAVFQSLEGVDTVISGYAGGKIKNPSYKEVCSGNTGHAEVCQINFDPNKISYEDLLKAFWLSHDPTTMNRQGNDEGTQYRSVIFYHNDTQKEIAKKLKKELDASGSWDAPIINEISPLTNFYAAENYHQNYYNSNPNQSYCSYVIGPKLEKFKKVFKEKLKK